MVVVAGPRPFQDNVYAHLSALGFPEDVLVFL